MIPLLHWRMKTPIIGTKMGVGAGWYYDSLDNDVVHQNLAESLANALVTYYHGPYSTEQEAETHTGVAGPPGTPNENLGQQAAGVAGQDILGGINIGNLVLRAGEILLGIVLIGVGIAKLTGAENLVSTAVKGVVP